MGTELQEKMDDTGFVGGLEELEGKERTITKVEGKKKLKSKKKKTDPGRQLHGVFVLFCTPATEQEAKD